jgi:hypothetical protein
MVAPVSRAFLALRSKQAVHCGLLTRIHEGMRIYPRVLCSVRCPCRTQAQLVSWILVDVRLLHVLTTIKHCGAERFGVCARETRVHCCVYTFNNKYR